MTEHGKGFLGKLGVQDRAGITSLIRTTCDLADMSDSFDDIVWSFNGRLKTTLGRAWYKDSKVEFCFNLWDKASYEQRRSVIIHEVVHVLCFIKYQKNCGHSNLWKSMMIQCDGDTSRCHDVDTSQQRRNHKCYIIKCRCRAHEITSNRFSRMKRGSKYKCGVCGYGLNIEDAVLKDWWLHE